MMEFKADTSKWVGLWAMQEQALKSFVSTAKPNKAPKAKKSSKAAGKATETPPKANGEPYAVAGTAAIIPIVGCIEKYATDEAEECGVSSLTIQAQIGAALADDAIESIVLFIDSPGGTVAGTADLAAFILEARQQKPINAYVSDHCFSAAYWIASQCSTITANESAFVGSIGVYSVLIDSSAAALAAGVAVKLVAAGEYKGIETDGIPIDDKAIAETQRSVNSAADLFINAIAEGRKLAISEVRQLADGRTHVAREALAMKLIDAIGTIDVAINLKGNTMDDNKKVDAPAPVAPAADDVLKQILDAITALGSKIDDLTNNDDSDDTDDSTDDKADDSSDVDAKAAAAVALDRERLKAISDAVGARADFAMSQFLAGKTPTEAKAALADVLATENAALRKSAKSDGIEPIAFGGTITETDATDPETIWAKNINNVQESYSGKKEYFLAALKHNKKINKGAK